MSIPKALVSRLVKQHPECEELLTAFVPLLEAQRALAEKLPALELPPLDRAAFAQGKAWLPVTDAVLDVYLDKDFVKAAPAKIAAAAAKGLTGIGEEAKRLGGFLGKEPALCRELAAMGLRGESKKIKSWAKKQGFGAELCLLFALHLSGAAALRVARAAGTFVLPDWMRNTCPVCGSPAHGSFLKGKEGKRYLQCSLCRYEWQFSRTTCPVCGQDSPSDLPLFFLEERRFERGEACDKCNHYLLGLDVREMSDAPPLELFFLCMAPLDMLMQEKGFTPVAEASR